MHTAIQAKSIEQEIPGAVEKTIDRHGPSVYLQREEEVCRDLWRPSPQAWPTRTINMKLTNIDRRAYSLSKKRLSLHS